MEAYSKWKKFSYFSFLDVKEYNSMVSDATALRQLELTEVWEGIDIPKNRDECFMRNKFLIRKGVPDVCRGYIWKVLLDCPSFLRENPLFYSDTLFRVFGEHVARSVINVPTFGGVLKIEEHNLTPSGADAVKRILCVVAMEYVELEQLPFLPDLICILLQFMNEPESYTTFYLMHKFSMQKKIHYFIPNKKGFGTWLQTFDDLLRSHIPKIGEKMDSLGVKSTDFAQTWYSRLYVGTLPYLVVLRLFDTFISEGDKILFRVGLAILKLARNEVLNAKTKQEFLDILSSFCGQLFDAEKLMKKAFGLRNFKRSSVLFHNTKNQNKVEVPESSGVVYYRPRINTTSEIFSETHFEFIWSWLPSYIRIKNPILLFRTSRDGFNLNSFLKKVSTYTRPSILGIKTSKHDVFFFSFSNKFSYSVINYKQKLFGAFVSDGWHIQQNFYGNRDCFVFKLVPKPEEFKWIEGNTDMFMKVTSEYLQVGGGSGGFSIQIDNEFNHGITQTTSTFLNSPLTADLKENFECICLEVWGFS